MVGDSPVQTPTGRGQLLHVSLTRSPPHPQCKDPLGIAGCRKGESWVLPQGQLGVAGGSGQLCTGGPSTGAHKLQGTAAVGAWGQSGRPWPCPLPAHCLLQPGGERLRGQDSAHPDPRHLPRCELALLYLAASGKGGGPAVSPGLALGSRSPGQERGPELSPRLINVIQSSAALM